MQNTITLITNEKELSELIKQKIFLLRESDSFKTIGSAAAFEFVKKDNPSLVIYHLKNSEKEKEEEFLNFLNKIKQNEKLKTTSVLLLFDEFDEECLCNAYEKGITDFVTMDSSDTEFTIRTIWCLKKQELLSLSENKQEILSELKITDKITNVYTENYTYTVLKEESKKNWGTFVVVAPDINVRSKISPENLMSTIKKTVRVSDILGFASDFKIYLWFRKTEKKNIITVLNKIQKELTSEFSISAGYIEIKNIPFDEAEEQANKALSKALLKGSCFLYAEESKKKEINLDINVKNFKLQKENFVKQLENILSPLFYQTQQRSEQKLFETDITQKVSEEKSIFKLKNNNGESTFKVSYPGYTKINIEIIHNIKNAQLEAEKLFMDTDELSEEKIDYLLQKFINEFQKRTNS